MSLKLSDLTEDDAKERIKAAVVESQQKVKDIADFYEGLTGTKLPASVQDYADGRWKDLLTDSAKEVLEFYDPHQQHIDRKRVLTVSSAIKVLEDYETELVKRCALDPRGVLLAGKARTVRIAEYLAAHAGELVIAEVDDIQLFAGAVQKAVKFNLWELLNPWAILKLPLEVGRWIVIYLPRIIEVAATGIAAIVTAAFIDAIAAAWSKTNYKLNVKAINEARKTAEAVARSRALPQRKGRVRRRKRSRH